MTTARPFSRTFALAAAVAAFTVHAEDHAVPQRLGEHPAVLIARQGVHADPTANFYLHPARLDWSSERSPDVAAPAGERPAVLFAREQAAIDPNRYVLRHPAGGTPSPALR